MVGSEDDIILDAYRLARWYHVSPDVFLRMTFSDLERHLHRTAQISRLQQPDEAEE